MIGLLQSLISSHDQGHLGFGALFLGEKALDGPCIES